MSKKISPNWRIALTYYIGTNLIALVPELILGILMNWLIKSTWLFLILNVLFGSIIFYFSLLWSSRNINKVYVIKDKKIITKWSLAYLFFFNLTFLIIFFLKVNYISVSLISSILNLIVAAALIYHITDKFVNLTSQSEIENSNSMVSKSKGSAAKQVFRTASLMIGGVVFLLLIPLIGYFRLTVEVLISPKLTLFIILIYFVIILVLARRFIFKKVREPEGLKSNIVK